ncbi:hypothetical protein [Myroides sp. LJL119]
MKKLTIVAALLGSVYFANAQVGIGTPDPALSAELEVKSDSKGILIPRVALTDLTSYKPIVGDAQQSLLIYNITQVKDTDIAPGFYYWEDNMWNRVVNKNELNIIVEEIGGDITNIQNIIDFILPSNPDNDKDDQQKPPHTTVVYNTTTKKFETVTYNSVTNVYESEEIDFNSLETITQLKRSEIQADGVWVDFEQTSVAPDPSAVKKGEIFYEYTSEDSNRKDYINMTDDIIFAIENNEELRNSFTKFLSEGGNVYYGDHDNNPSSGDVLYTIDDNGNKTEIVFPDSFILKLIEKNIQRIKNMLGDKIQVDGDTIINTGDTINGEWVFKYMGKTQVGSQVGVPSAATSGVGLPADSNATGLVSITLLDSNKNVVATNATNVVVTGNNIAFNIGTGNHYTALPQGEYNVIVEFTSSNVPATILGPSTPVTQQP